ncbi:elongation factor Ts, mitochondrial-like [Gossypium australe]|uniref:Elongation factor Ts, mitochondrial n=1 Tax=Gossypium australe TaxID=47621 RepID=A0A5B6UM15_9ROSI|nr:elongation factor Ts, mitochondrial-like [Gossypium australe]
MAFFRNAKQPLGILLYNTRLSTCSRHGYSTWATKGTSFAQSTDTKASKTTYLYWVSRRFNSQAASSAEQMSLIKQLRERTSAPIKDVKASLVDCNWDIEAAQKELRKRGKVLAMKKSSRTATEGLLALAQNEGKAAVIELNCETDFVARNEIFEYLALSLAKKALFVQNSSQHIPGVFSFGPECLEDLKLNLDHPKVSGETTIQNAVTEVAAMMGENIKLRRGVVMSTSSHGVVSAYLHRCPQPGLGRIAGILSLEVKNEISQLETLQKVGSELAMHIVAAKPLFLTKELVTSDVLNNEREILKSQLIATYRYKALENAKPSWIYLQNTCQHVISCIIFGSSFILMHHIQCNVTILVLNFISMDTDLFLCQAISTGKSSMAIEKMVDGRLRKYFEEVVFMEQKYFLNDSLSIKTILDNVSKEVGSPVKIGNFFRMEVGEGIQSQEASSSAEPVAQAV